LATETVTTFRFSSDPVTLTFVCCYEQLETENELLFHGKTTSE
jgi:hypothetical protein